MNYLWKISVDHKIFLPILLITLLLTVVFVSQPLQRFSARKTFAACLTSKGVAMYGSDTCAECQTQKGMFEDDFREIQYINCDFHQEECQQKGIQKWPTWMYNGQAFVGVQRFQDLAGISGCVAPSVNN